MMGSDGTEIEKLIEDKTLRISRDRKTTTIKSRQGSNSPTEGYETPPKAQSPKNVSVNLVQSSTSAQKLLRKKPSVTLF